MGENRQAGRSASRRSRRRPAACGKTGTPGKARVATQSCQPQVAQSLAAASGRRQGPPGPRLPRAAQQEPPESHAPLAIPSAGPAACSRKRRRDRPSPVAVLARMRSGQSAFGSLAGLSAGGGRRPRAPPALRPGRRQGLQAAVPRFRDLRPRRAPAARQRPIRRTKRAGRRIHVRRRFAPAARAGARATPGSQPAPPGIRRRLGAAAAPMPAAPVTARRRAARIRRAGPLLRPRPFPRRLGPLPLAAERAACPAPPRARAPRAPAPSAPSPGAPAPRRPCPTSLPAPPAAPAPPASSADPAHPGHPRAPPRPTGPRSRRATARAAAPRRPRAPSVRLERAHRNPLHRLQDEMRQIAFRNPVADARRKRMQLGGIAPGKLRRPGCLAAGTTPIAGNRCPSPTGC